MATYLKRPKSWREADGVYRSAFAHRPKNGRDQKLGHETYLMRVGDKYAIRHWETQIVTFHKDGSITLNAAKVSKPTADRMMAFTPDTIVINVRGLHTDEPHYVIKTPTGTSLLFEDDEKVIPGNVAIPLPQRTSKREVN